MDTRTSILTVATRLFSAKGYDGVSMRNIADEVKISAPALYNHFSDKQTLYLTAISEAFENKSNPIIDVVNGPGTALERLEKFLLLHCTLMHEDQDFHRLIHRELLDGDEKRLEYLAQEVFSPAFSCIKDLLIELKPDCDADILIVMIIGMTHKHFELNPLIKNFSDYKPEHNDPSYITAQVMAVLSAFLGDKA